MARLARNAADRMAARYIPTGATPILEHENGSALFTYERGGKLYAISFWGTAAKPFEHHSYRTEQQRYDAIQAFKRSIDASVAFRSGRDAARKATKNALKVGHIVYTSWGYDQTNVDFYIVTRATDASVWVRQIVQDSEATGSMQEKCWPKMPIEMVGPETRHVARGTSCLIKGHHASLEEGCTHHSSSYA